MTTPIFPSVIGHNLLDGGTDAQDGNNYPGPDLREFASATALSGTTMQAKKLSNVLTKSFIGRYTTVANGADHTTSIQMALESPYDAVRFIIPNSVTSSIANCKMKITTGGAAGTAGTYGAQAPSDGSWKSVLVGGSATFTLAAGTSVDVPSFTVTDWYDLSSATRTDGGTLPLLWARILIPAAAANRPAYNYASFTKWETESEVAGRIFRCRTQAVNGVDTLGNFTTAGSASDYQCVPIIVQYRTRVNGVTVMVAGDSIYEKAGSTSRYGWQDISQAAVSTPSRPVEIATMAIGGSNSTTMAARINACLSVINPDFCILPGYEVNDMSAPMTQAEINLNERNVETSLGYLRAADVVPSIATGLPTNPVADGTGTDFPKDYGSSDALRRARNERIRAMRGVYVLDFDAVLAGATDGDGQVSFATGTTDDALHPNNTGHDLLADECVIPFLRGLAAVNL